MKKKLLIGAGVVVVLAGIGSAMGDDGATSTTPTSTPAETTTTTEAPTTTTTEAPEAIFEGSVVQAFVVDPATLSVVVRVDNIGEVPGSPSCYVKASNPGGAYTGSDFFSLDQTIEPGEAFTGRLLLTIKSEGAAYITDVEVTCS